MSVTPTPPTVPSVAEAMVRSIDEHVLADLRAEDPVDAIELYFGPIRVKALGPGGGIASECSAEGFYDASTGSVPTILFSGDVAPARARFTLLHELGHHLLVTRTEHLLDEIDQLTSKRTTADQIEEKVCHQFAGDVLIANELLEAVVGGRWLRPSHLVDLYRQCNASWEAVAVRAASASQVKTAVVLLREEGQVGFCAASSRLAAAWWPRGSLVTAGGPLDRSLQSNQTARPEVYRANLAYAESMYCDSLMVSNGMAIAVLSDKPSDGRFDIPEEPDPLWKERDNFCERCNEARTEGWCEACRGRHCPECERCACSPLASNPTCPGCSLASPRRPGAPYCFTCEADGLGS